MGDDVWHVDMLGSRPTECHSRRKVGTNAWKVSFVVDTSAHNCAGSELSEQFRQHHHTVHTHPSWATRPSRIGNTVGCPEVPILSMLVSF